MFRTAEVAAAAVGCLKAHLVLLSIRACFSLYHAQYFLLNYSANRAMLSLPVNMISSIFFS